MLSRSDCGGSVRGRFFAASLVLGCTLLLSGIASAQDQGIDSAYTFAENGAWVPAARAWRHVLDHNQNLALAAAYTLRAAPADARPTISATFLAPPLSPGARRTLAQLDLAWGQPREGWTALEALPPGDSAGDAWLEFADAARTSGAAAIAREAYNAALGVHPSADVAAHGAAAALASGDAGAALTMLQRATTMPGAGDSATIAGMLLPLRIRALARLGRMAAAESVMVVDGKRLGEGSRLPIEREVAWGYVRLGDIDRARAAAAKFGLSDDPDVRGWLALYEGDLKTARRDLKHPGAMTGDGLTAMTVLSRTTADSAPLVGRAFVLLARGDTAAAAEDFVTASSQLIDAAPLLLVTAARLHAAQRRDSVAIGLWRVVIERYNGAPEAPEADLEWGRVLRRRSDNAGAVERWEHLILNYPESALVPLARQELEALRATAWRRMHDGNRMTATA